MSWSGDVDEGNLLFYCDQCWECWESCESLAGPAAGAEIVASAALAEAGPGAMGIPSMGGLPPHTHLASKQGVQILDLNGSVGYENVPITTWGLPPHTHLAGKAGPRMLDVNGSVLSPTRKDNGSGSTSAVSSLLFSASMPSITPAFRTPSGSTLATTAASQGNSKYSVLTPDAGSDPLNPLEQQWLKSIISIIRKTADGATIPITARVSLIGQKAASLRPPGSNIKMGTLLQSPEAVRAGIRVAGSSGKFVVTLCQQEPLQGGLKDLLDSPALKNVVEYAPDQVQIMMKTTFFGFWFWEACLYMWLYCKCVCKVCCCMHSMLLYVAVYFLCSNRSYW